MSQDSENQSLAAMAVTDPGPDAGLTDEQVVAYLREHPDFFAQRAALLQIMTPPARWSGDTVVDMQRYMVESLRGEIAGLRDCANEVIETSRANLAIQSRTHAAVLALVAAPDLDQRFAPSATTCRSCSMSMSPSSASNRLRDLS